MSQINPFLLLVIVFDTAKGTNEGSVSRRLPDLSGPAESCREVSEQGSGVESGWVFGGDL